MMEMALQIIKPQPGPQTKFLTSPADIAFLGGAAGGGKSYGLLLDPLYHYDNPFFNAVAFRRTTVQCRNPGGLWDQSSKLYPLLGAKPKEASLQWQFPDGLAFKLAHLEHESNIFDWQGSELAWVGFDEITHFTERQVVYLLSRMRSMSGVPARMRGTCNPDADSWVRRWVDWWIGSDGYAIRERSGVLRYFVRIDDEMMWADSRQELIDKFGKESSPKSFTFIPAKLQDNKILMEKDPSYLGNLKAMARVERMRLLEGNWDVKGAAGMYFQKSYFEVIETCGQGPTIRYWDRAATKPHEGNKDPDWTAGFKLRRLSNGVFVIMDIVRERAGPMEIERLVKNTALQDGHEVEVGIEQDPGSAGVADAQNYVRMLSGFNVRVHRPTKDKITRALPLSAAAEGGNVKVLRGNWNDPFFKEAENFGGEGSKNHDDQIDAGSGAYNRLVEMPRDDFAPINITGQSRWI